MIVVVRKAPPSGTKDNVQYPPKIFERFQKGNKVLYRIVDQNGEVYRSNRFRGYYNDQSSAQRAIKLLPKTRVRYLWDEESRSYTQTVTHTYDWRIQCSKEEWYDVS